MTGLGPAHRGYEYQDLLIAIRLVDVLLGEVVRAWVDEKLVSPDLFDDLTTLDASGRRERVQFKHSSASAQPVSLATFTTNDRGLRLDKVIDCAIASRNTLGELTLRILFGQARPIDSTLLALLRQAEPETRAFVAGSSTYRCRFRHEALCQFTESDGQAGSVSSAIGRMQLDDEDISWLCEHLMLEFEAPAASFDLTDPGPAEALLLHRVRREIGAESYPNAHRSAVDVAAGLVVASRAARLQRGDISIASLLRKTGLRCDFGAVTEHQPIDPQTEIARLSAVLTVAASFERAASSGLPLIVVGPPGQGKSWLCQQAILGLEESGWLIAEHYCYLSRDDIELSARTRSEVVLGSLLARLAASEPSLVVDQRPRYAANQQALCAAVGRARAARPDRKVALVVDGLDHVTRVQGRANASGDPSRDLAVELAALELPQGSVLVVLSQPGQHLEPFDEIGAMRLAAPPLSNAEIADLARQLGAVKAGETGRLPTTDDDRERRFIELLQVRSGGNALYATYLCRESMRAPTGAEDSVELIRRVPAYDGSLRAYYEYIMGSLADARWVAETLALIDFAVSRSDLRCIRPADAHRVDEAVDRLLPVVAERVTHGGLRIYHESFARFILEPLDPWPSARYAVLESIVLWLENRGMLADSRAYRFLFPTLARLNRHREIITRVRLDFVASSVEAGFMAAAIKANLRVAVAAAAQVNDWAVIVRFLELTRAAERYEYEGLDSKVIDFADVPIALLGPETFAERLLYDGQPTVAARLGLQLCAAVDAVGVPAPWQEYLDAFERERHADSVSYSLEVQQQVNLAVLRGRLRLADPSRVRGWLVGLGKWFDSRTIAPASLVAAIWDTWGDEGVRAFLSGAPDPADYRLAFAEKLFKGQPRDRRRAVAIARRLAKHSAPPWSRHRLRSLGVKTKDDGTEGVSLRRSLLSLTKGVQRDRQSAESEPVQRWLDACLQAAELDAFALATAEAMISGDGWYRCWLRFALSLCRAEAGPEQSRSQNALAALRLLTDDMHPFAGKPRACDLYWIRAHMATTFQRALEALDDDMWQEGVAILHRVAAEIDPTFKGESGGPLPLSTFVDLVIATTSATRQEATHSIVAEILERSSSGFYSDIGGYYLAAARWALACNDRDSAASHWKAACAMLVAYGFHKDITIFETVDSLPVLIDVDRFRACSRIAAIQATCTRVLNHTDGDETRHGLAQWWRLVSQADPRGFAELYRTQSYVNSNLIEDVTERARGALWDYHHAEADPLVAGALRLALFSPIRAKDGDFARRLWQSSDSDPKALLVLQLLAARHDEQRRSSARGDSKLSALEHTETVQLNEVMSEAGLAPVLERPSWDVHEGASTSAPLGDERSLADRLDSTVLERFGPGAAGLRRIVDVLRAKAYDDRSPKWHSDRLVNAIGYRLLERKSSPRPVVT